MQLLLSEVVESCEIPLLLAQIIVITPPSSIMFESFIVHVVFETLGNQIWHFPSLPTKAYANVWQEIPLSEVLGKRLQNVMVLFSQVSDTGRVEVLSKLWTYLWQCFLQTVVWFGFSCGVMYLIHYFCVLLMC